MDDINKDSQEYIAWLKKYLEEDANYEDLLKEVRDRFEWFLKRTSKEEMIQLLVPKQVKGAKEYGPPYYSIFRISREFRDELIDLLGWSLIGRFNRKKRKP